MRLLSLRICFYHYGFFLFLFLCAFVCVMTTAAAAALASAKDARERYDVYASARLLGCSFQAQMVDASDIEEIDPSWGMALGAHGSAERHRELAETEDYLALRQRSDTWLYFVGSNGTHVCIWYGIRLATARAPSWHSAGPQVLRQTLPPCW